MKKTISLFIIIFLFASIDAFADIDLTSMTLDELLSLQQQISIAIENAQEKTQRNELNKSNNGTYNYPDAGVKFEKNCSLKSFDTSSIIDIWDYGSAGNYGLRCLLSCGYVIDIEFPDGTYLPQIKRIATNVKKVFHTGMRNIDIFIGYDDKAALEESKRYDYELDEEWHNLVLASASRTHAVGLREDGKWVVSGSYHHGECDVDDWTDVISVRTGADYTIGLKSNGTVIATGVNDEGQCNTSKWTDIVQISVNNSTTVGLKSDGTVVATGNNDDGQMDVADWSHIKYIDTSLCSSYGLTENGELLTTCDSYFKSYKDGRLIPRKYRCENAKAVFGTYCPESESRGANYIVVINNDNTIEIFGRNENDQCIKMMDTFNNGTSNSNKEYKKSKSQKSDFAEDYYKKIATTYLKQYLKNPESLQIHNVSSTINGTDYTCIIDYSAMNSFGGYTRSTFICVVDTKTDGITSGYIY